MRAHRVAYVLATGEQPGDAAVLHECPDGRDARNCVNPAHLVLGTHAKNMARMDQLGRRARGELAGASKLTRAQVVAIRSEATLAQSELATKYGVHTATISRIRRGLWWREVADEVPTQYAPHGEAELTAAQVAVVLGARERSGASLGREFGVSRQAISLIRRGINWKSHPARRPHQETA